MSRTLKNIFSVVVYFFTPEDSETRYSNGTISFRFDSKMFDLGSLKALFWVVIAIAFIPALSMLQ